jgi:hypothetical protein
MIDLVDEDARFRVHDGDMGDDVWLVHEGAQVLAATNNQTGVLDREREERTHPSI